MQLGSCRKPANLCERKRKRLDRSANLSQGLDFAGKPLHRPKGIKQSDVCWNPQARCRIVSQAQLANNPFNFRNRYNNRRFISHVLMLFDRGQMCIEKGVRNSSQMLVRR
jgi:hypothetical protein